MKPKGQIALKFPTSVYYTKILNVVYSFKGTQDVGIVAEIEPTEIDNTVVKRASLKSWKWICDNDIKIGAIVGIIKGGDIIPCITEVVSSGDISLVVPVKCPYCYSDVLEGEAQLYCSNDMCDAKEASRISRFLKILGVKGLAHKTLLKYTHLGIQLKHFVAKEFNLIENLIKQDPKISLVIWEKVRKQLEAK